jgi:hypothetical protein
MNMLSNFHGTPDVLTLCLSKVVGSPEVLEPQDAQRWMNPETPVEEAAHTAQSRSSPTVELQWWHVSREVNRADPGNNGKHLLAPVQVVSNCN